MNELQEFDDLLREALPTPMFRQYLREATQSVEDELALEDQGWVNFSTGAYAADTLTATLRKNSVLLSRNYYYTDPMAAQAIRLWTDYTFGSGITWNTEEEPTKKALEAVWNDPANQCVYSAKGQRKSSDKLLVDGEIFFAIFLGTKGEAKVRRIDPLEITELISLDDDLEEILYYKREWGNRHGVQRTAYYRSITNKKAEPATDYAGASVTHTEEALVYHLPFRTLGQRGTSLLLPVHFYLKYNRKFIAARIAIMLALTRFAWKTKVKGGQTAVDTVKAVTHDQEVPAASTVLENLGVDTTQLKVESGAKNAYTDNRMIKLMIASGVGIPEQYFGDISIGNLATAKTVELPMMKMFQSYQAVWLDAYETIDNVILENANIPEGEKRYVDRDFPPIAPADTEATANAIVQVLGALPELAESEDVKQIALLTLGVNDPSQVLAALSQEAIGNPNPALTKALKGLREALRARSGNGSGEAIEHGI